MIGVANAHVPGSQVKEAAFPQLFSAGQVVRTAPICPLAVAAFRAVTPFQFSPLGPILLPALRHPSVADLLLSLVSVTGAGKVFGRGEGAELGRVRSTHRGEAGVGQAEHARMPEEKYRPRPQPGVVSDQVLLLRQSDSGVDQVFVNVVIKCVLFADRDRWVKKFLFVDSCLLKTRISLAVLQPRSEENSTE